MTCGGVCQGNRLGVAFTASGVIHRIFPVSNIKGVHHVQVRKIFSCRLAIGSL